MKLHRYTSYSHTHPCMYVNEESKEGRKDGAKVVWS